MIEWYAVLGFIAILGGGLLLVGFRLSGVVDHMIESDTPAHGTVFRDGSVVVSSSNGVTNDWHKDYGVVATNDICKPTRQYVDTLKHRYPNPTTRSYVNWALHEMGEGILAYGEVDHCKVGLAHKYIVDTLGEEYK